MIKMCLCALMKPWVGNAADNLSTQFIITITTTTSTTANTTTTNNTADNLV